MDAAPGLRHQERLLPTLNAVLMPATTARFHDSATAYAFTKPFFLFRPRPPPLSFASTRSPFLLPFSASLCLGRSCAGCVYQAATFSSSNIQGFISLSTIALGCTTWFRDGSVLLVSLVLTKRIGGMEFFPGHLVHWEPYSDPYLRRGRDMRGWFCLFLSCYQASATATRISRSVVSAVRSGPVSATFEFWVFANCDYSFRETQHAMHSFYLRSLRDVLRALIELLLIEFLLRWFR